MNPRDEVELLHHRRALWTFYAAINPGAAMRTQAKAGEHLWVASGEVALADRTAKFYLTFRLAVRRNLNLAAKNIQEIDERFVQTGILEVMEAWMDRTPGIDRQAEYYADARSEADARPRIVPPE